MLYWKQLTSDETKRIGVTDDDLSNSEGSIYQGYFWSREKFNQDGGNGPWNFLGLILNEISDMISIKGCHTGTEVIHWLKSIQRGFFDPIGSGQRLHLSKEAAFELLELLRLAATKMKEGELSHDETFEHLNNNFLPEPLKIENLPIKPKPGYQEIHYQYQSNLKYGNLVILLRFTTDFHSIPKAMFLNIFQIDRQEWENQTFTRTSLYDTSRLQITLGKKGLTQLCTIMADVLSIWSSEF